MAFKMSGFSYPGKSPLKKGGKIPKDQEGRLEWARKPENRFRLKDLANPNSLMGGMGQSKIFGQLLEQVQAEEAVGGSSSSNEKAEAKQEQKTSLDTKVEVAPTGPGKALESKKEE